MVETVDLKALAGRLREADEETVEVALSGSYVQDVFRLTERAALLARRDDRPPTGLLGEPDD